MLLLVYILLRTCRKYNRKESVRVVLLRGSFDTKSILYDQKLIPRANQFDFLQNCSRFKFFNALLSTRGVVSR